MTVDQVLGPVLPARSQQQGCQVFGISKYTHEKLVEFLFSPPCALAKLRHGLERIIVSQGFSSRRSIGQSPWHWCTTLFPPRRAAPRLCLANRRVPALAWFDICRGGDLHNAAAVAFGLKLALKRSIELTASIISQTCLSAVRSLSHQQRCCCRVDRTERGKVASSIATTGRMSGPYVGAAEVGYPLEGDLSFLVPLVHQHPSLLPPTSQPGIPLTGNTANYPPAAQKYGGHQERRHPKS